MTTKNKNKDFEKLYDLADKSGRKAVEDYIAEGKLKAMVVTDGGKNYYVADGLCGFAWIKIRPANCSFANWLKKNKGCQTAYDGGVDIWVGMYNQSVQKKETYANAFAKVLSDNGINAFAYSRLD